MELRRTRELLPRVEWRESSPSTNVELRELVEADPALPHGSLLATADQPVGRGRLGRGWSMPPSTALAMSVLVRDFGVADGAGAGLQPSWLPLIAGSAVVRALSAYYGEGMRVGVKWPNDVHVRDEDDAEAGRPGKKLCGILCELLPATGAGGRAGTAPSVIVGMGVNLLIPEDELPTDRATSLLASGTGLGVDEDAAPLTVADPRGAEIADAVIADTASELLRLVRLAGTAPEAVRTRVLRDSLTLGTEVRAHLPGGEIVDGFARELADDGSLVIDLPTGGVLTVSAGDIEHLR